MLRLKKIYISKYLLTLFLLSSACSSSLEVGEVQQVIQAGDHRTTKGRIDRFFSDTSINMTLGFGDNCYYHFENENQLDKNKREGIKFNLHPHGRTVMTWWRWNENTQNIEVGFYNHGILSGNRDYFIHGNGAKSSRDFIQVPKGASYSLNRRIKANAVITTICNQDTCLTDSVYFKKLPGRYRLVNPWFGGQEKAQRDHHFFTEFKK